MPKFGDVSKAKLATCDIRLQRILTEVIQHVDFVVLEGHRGEAAQNEALRKGTSKLPWPKGNHNSNPSRAVDIAPYFTSPGDKIDWKDLAAFGRLMGYVQRVAHEQGVKLRFGLDWDGDFRSMDEGFLDAPHIELVDP